MSTERDTSRIVRSWLRTDEHDSADRVLGVVLDRLDATPQRRATWWPVRRTPTMNKIVGFSLAAAAVVVVIVVGAQLFGSAGGLGAGPTPIPEPSVAEPTATPEPSPSSAADLEGPFVLSEEPAITVTFAAPGWSRENNLQIPAKHGSYFPPDWGIHGRAVGRL